MSAPSGKSFGPIRISDYAPKRVRDQLAAAERKQRDEPDPAPAGTTDPREDSLAPQFGDEAKEPSAPSRAPNDANERAAEERDRGNDDPIEHRSGQPRDSAREGAKETAYFDEEAHGDPRITDFDARRAAYDVDLQRLEAALLALRRGDADEAVSRLPPAPQLPRIQGLRSPDDVQIDGFRLPRSLEPSYVPPPPMRERKNHLGAVLRTLGAFAVAAPITYFAMNYFGATNELLTATRGPKLSAVETQTAALPPMPAAEPEASLPLPTVQASPESPAQPPQPPAPNRYQVQSTAPASASRETSDVATASRTPAASPASSPAPSPGLSQTPAPPPANRPAPREMSDVSIASRNPTASPPASPASSPAPSPGLSQTPAPPPANKPAPAVDREQIAMLLQQGAQFISAGDVATARVLFARAAEAGDGKAALALGATYDPAVLAKLGVRGIAPDAEKAHQWYQKARESGSPEAPDWLAKLADR